MRAREVREALKNKVDERLMLVLVKLAEDQQVLQQQIAQFGGILDQLIDQLTNMATVSGTLAKEVNKLKRIPGQKDMPDAADFG